MPIELLIVSIARALTEVAGWFMLGQGVLYVFAGSRRNENFVYQLFALLTRPIMRVTRVVTPRIVRDEHIWLAAFLLLLWLWLGLGVAKRYLCVTRDLMCA